MAARLGAPFKGLVYVNPALRSNAPLAPQVEWCDGYFNDGDHVVKFAAVLRLLAPWAPLGDRMWGDMGDDHRRRFHVRICRAVGVELRRVQEHHTAAAAGEERRFVSTVAYPHQ